MSDINRRLKKVEKALDMDKKDEKKIVEIVWYGGGELPKEHDNGYNIIRYVSCEDFMSEEQLIEWQKIKQQHAKVFQSSLP